MSKGGLNNPDWMKGFQPERKGAAQRVSGESDDLYELKCLNKTDINMINARKQYERPLWHLQFLKGDGNAEKR